MSHRNSVFWQSAAQYNYLQAFKRLQIDLCVAPCRRVRVSRVVGVVVSVLCVLRLKSYTHNREYRHTQFNLAVIGTQHKCLA